MSKTTMDPTDRFLRAMLRRTVLGVLGGGLSVAGCAASSQPGGGQPFAGNGGDGSTALLQPTVAPDPGVGPWRLVCADDMTWHPLERVYLGTAADYVGLYVGAAGAPPRVLDEVGTACATASERTRCLSLLDERTRAAGGAPRLVATRGDAVAFFDGGHARDLLGVIDSPDEAALVAFLNGHPAQCQRTRVSDGPAWQVATAAPCNVETVSVQRDGRTTTVEPAPACPPPEPPQAQPGRRPPGLCEADPRVAGTGPGAFFARAARYEAASVHAFHQLARELSALHAPRGLVRRAHTAAAEELAHTRAMGRLARRYGARPERAHVRPTARRDLLAIALDNAVEGCVNETFSALLATGQALHAQDPLVRAELTRIAEDETRHASFSLQLHRHALARLGRRDRARVEDARRRAAWALRPPMMPSMDARQLALLGLPGETQAAQLADALREAWL